MILLAVLMLSNSHLGIMQVKVRVGTKMSGYNATNFLCKHRKDVGCIPSNLHIQVYTSCFEKSQRPILLNFVYVFYTALYCIYLHKTTCTIFIQNRNEAASGRLVP